MSFEHAETQDMTHLELELSPEENTEPSVAGDINPENTMSVDQQNHTERRRNQRVKPQIKGLKGMMLRITDRLVKKLDSGLKGWLLLGGIIVLSLGLIGWSLSFRMHLLDDNYNLAAEHSGRLEKLDQLMLKWSEVEVTHLQARVSSAENRVFHDYTRLANWLHLKANAAEQLKLNMRYTLHPAQPSKINNVSEVPLDLQIHAQDGNTLVYLAMLEYIKSIINDQWHLEIRNALMQSNDKGVSDMALSIYVWVLNPDITPNATTKSNEEPAE